MSKGEEYVGVIDSVGVGTLMARTRADGVEHYRAIIWVLASGSVQFHPELTKEDYVQAILWLAKTYIEPGRVPS